MTTAARRYDERAKRSTSSYQLELGTKSLLSLFFALAIVCGLFFAFGYTLGKHAIPATFSLGASPNGHAAAAAPAPGVQAPNPAELGQAETNQTPDTLTTTTATTAAAPVTTPATTPPATPAATAAPPASAAATAAAAAAATPIPGGGVYHVQVFAGVQTDAQSVASHLLALGYPATVVGPAPGELNLYRVQVGPYLTPDEAQAMRSRLTADGYQAIVKNQ